MIISNLLMKGAYVSIAIATAFFLFHFLGQIIIHRYNKLYRNSILYEGHPFMNLVDAYFTWTVALKYSIRLAISTTVVLSTCFSYYYLKIHVTRSTYDEIIGVIVGWALPILIVRLITLLNNWLFNATFQNAKHDLLVCSSITVLILILTDFENSFGKTAIIAWVAFLLNTFLCSLMPWHEAKKYFVEKLFCGGVYFSLIFILHLIFKEYHFSNGILEFLVENIVLLAGVAMARVAESLYFSSDVTS